MSILASLASMKRQLLDIFFPIECVGCGSEGTWLCNICAKKIIFNNEFACPLCGHFSFRGNSCFSCLKHAKLQGAFIVGKYNDIVRQLIQCLKYNGIKDIADILGSLMVRFLESNNIKNDFDIIIPAPLHKRKELWRGFNQSYLLAQRISEYFHIVLDSTSLIRKKFTQSQTRMKREQRFRNIQNAFQVTDPVPIAGKRILVIDDVLTTGATLEGCAQALSEAGASSIWGLVLAKR